MTPFKERSIPRKLLLMTLAASGAALVVAGGGFLAWDLAQFRSDVRQDIAAQALLVAENSTAPLEFADARTATKNLAVLRVRPRVEMACLYGLTGELFATYQRDRDDACPPHAPATPRSTWQAMEIVMPVLTGDSQAGTLYLRRELVDMYTRLRIGGAAVLGLLALAIAAAVVLAASMQRAIVSPLLRLTETARTISTTRNYSLRAVQGSNDEIGVLVYAFNDMLDRIAERTSELSKTNAELEREIVERRRVEAERTGALERERDANRLKDEFLATLSHELRTPLNAVLGWTRVLRSARVEASTQSRALESIERNARAQARLIEDLLEVSRIVTGRLRLHVRESDLAEIVEAAVEVVRPAAVAKRLHLVVEVSPRPAMTLGDPDRLQQIVWNLLSNAVKFTPPEGSVWITLERTDGYHLVVRDSGQGIDAKFLPFVFEQFRQADGTSSREHGGLGLGLAIAKQLTELHGGTITVASDGGGAGTSFEVTLPSVLTASVPLVTKSDSVAVLPANAVDFTLLRDVRVLVVDDEEDARALLDTALSHYGATVATATSVHEAFAEIDRQPPDVVLSDIGMPHEDGYVLIRRLRARPFGHGGSIPAVAVTAYASLSDRSAVEAAGYQAHVAKPFEPATVAALVARLARSSVQPR